MTLKEVQNEISRLRSIEKRLEKEEREKHKAAAREFVGKCYKRSDGVVLKIVSIPVETWDRYGANYNQYQFPALFLQYPSDINDRRYQVVDIDEFVPCYCDNVYLDINRGVPGLNATLRENHSYQEISQEEFAAEFDKCIESFKEQLGMRKPAPMTNKHTCKYVYRTFEDLDGPQYWCKLYNKDCDNCQGGD
jgi:hypothetical protein